MIIVVGLSTSVVPKFAIGLPRPVEDSAVALLSDVRLGLVAYTTSGPTLAMLVSMDQGTESVLDAEENVMLVADEVLMSKIVVISFIAAVES